MKLTKQGFASTTRTSCCCVFAAALAFGGVPARALAEEYEDIMVGDTLDALVTQVNSSDTIAISGIFGTCTWSIDHSGMLTLDSGTLPSNRTQTSDFWPWHQYRDYVTSVLVSDEVELSESARCLFSDLSNATSFNIYSLNTSATTDMGNMFDGCSSLEFLDLVTFDTSKVTNMARMFDGCSALENLGITSLETPRLMNTWRMFSGCSSLAALDLSSFDTSKVTYMGSMFSNCSALQALDLSSFDTKNVTNMSEMFAGCSSLAALDLSSFDTSGVTDMYAMFSGCTSLGTLDLSSFNTAIVQDTEAMFANCSTLAQISVGSMYGTNKAEAFPLATAQNGKWWSSEAQQWFTVEQIASNRNGIADTYLNEGKDETIDISQATVEPIPNQIYTGSALRPIPVVSMGGKTLELNVDYTVTHKNNIGAGVGTVVISGTGNYTGTKEATYNIVRGVVFTDVNATTPHAGDIEWLANKGISTGWTMPDGTAEFRPYANVARADMAAFLFRLARSWNLASDSWQPEGDSAFLDVTPQTAHYREIMWLAQSGISQGWSVSGGKEFRPLKPVARADMAAFLHRLATLAHIESPTGTGVSFVDVTQGTAHANDITWLAATGVSQGWDVSGGKEFRPLWFVARADMAAFLHRLDGLFGV